VSIFRTRLRLKRTIGFATGLHDYAKPCAGEESYFWILRLYPTHVPSLAPDIHASDTYDDYVHRGDPLLDRARALVRKERALRRGGRGIADAPE